MLRHPSYRTEPERHSAWPRPKSDGPMRILVIEDDKKTADYILKGLAECGYTADWAADGPDGLHRATSRRSDARRPAERRAGQASVSKFSSRWPQYPK